MSILWIVYSICYHDHVQKSKASVIKKPEFPKSLSLFSFLPSHGNIWNPFEIWWISIVNLQCKEIEIKWDIAVRFF